MAKAAGQFTEKRIAKAGRLAGSEYAQRQKGRVTEYVWPELGWSEEVTACWKDGPTARYEKILDRALELVRGVPYQVTLRWLFYNLWQEGWFSGQKASSKAGAKKLAYGNFARRISSLRHSPASFQERWPIELADDRRDPVHWSNGSRTPFEWLQSIYQEECNIDKHIGQDVYLMLAFEAEAMQSQFIHYAKPYGISLWPFSGMTSIAYKKRLANHIEWAAERFDLPVEILYFGDLDPAGMRIPETAFRHVRKWCKVPFKAYRVGLNEEHVLEYSIPDDPDNPGKYQWEAVNDQAAREIITGALDARLRQDAISRVVAAEESMTRKFRAALEAI